MSEPEPIAYVHLEADDADTAVYVERFGGRGFTAPFVRPHRHAYHEILWCERGRGRHSVDGRRFELEPHTVGVVATGQVHLFEEAVDLHGCLLRFTDEFLGRPGRDNAAVGPALFGGPRPNGALSAPAAERADLGLLFELIAAEYECEDSPEKYHVLRHLVLALIARIGRLQRAPAVPVEHAAETRQALYGRFLAELERSFRTRHDVGHYARALDVTPAALAALLQGVVGKPTKRLLLERILVEARRYLRFTEMPVKEIAGRLGFRDPYHFSKVFAREVGVSPSAYRERQTPK